MRNFFFVAFVLVFSPVLFAQSPNPQFPAAHYSVTITATAQGPHGKQSKSLVLAWLSPGGNAGFSAGTTPQMYKPSPNSGNCWMQVARPDRHQVRLQCHGSFLWQSQGPFAHRLDFNFNSGFPLDRSIVVFRSRNRHDVRYQVKVLVKKVA